MTETDTPHSPHLNEEAIFAAVLEITDPAQRSAFLDQACGQELPLRQRVEALLKRHFETRGFLDSPPRALAATSAMPDLTERPGTTIGPYKLLQQLGEGGMGVVYMAEQKEPVKRRVALKIIKPGMDTRQVIARFEAERQALAMMDHPNIAKVLDAGQTESGRPYFVMELVKGMPVTNYCDEQHLTPKERLELFVPICQAVQHAHQKGIIHRDLKPSNILVALYDGKPVPKIIDFGVAKATSQTLTEKTMFTQVGQVVGTLEYMAPEQAQVNQLDVDTRSDIYSLGVVLYELLTGETPFDRARLRSAAFDEMLRIIREEEPSKPSTKVSSSQSLPSIAANRRIEPAKLGSMIRGELDWIVLKAMEKDRVRRYETASAFAADVQHYLNDEAVVACPPSRAYRFRKLVQRNKTAMATTGLVVIALMVGIVGTSWQAVQASRERNRAILAEEYAIAEAKHARGAERVSREEAERADREASAALQARDTAKTEAAIARAVNAFVNSDLLGSADTHHEPERDLKVREVLDRASRSIADRFSDQPLVEAAIRDTIGKAYLSLGEPAKAAPHFERAKQIRREILGDDNPEAVQDAIYMLNVKHDLGDFSQGLPEAERIAGMATTLWGQNAPMTLNARYNVADFLFHLGDLEESERVVRDVIERSQNRLGAEGVLSTSMNLLGILLKNSKRGTEAEIVQRRLLDLQRRLKGPEAPQTLVATCNLANTLRGQERYVEAESELRFALGIQRRVLGATHPDTVSTISNLAATVFNQQRFGEAAELHKEALQALEARCGVDDPKSLHHLRWLALSVYKQDKPGDAEPLFREWLDRRSHRADTKSIEILEMMLYLARVCRAQGHSDDAERAYRDILKIDERHFWACVELGLLLAKRDNHAEAVALMEIADKNCPGTDAANNKLGLAFKSLGIRDKAEAAFQRCIAMDSQDTAARFNLTVLYIEREQPARAIECMQEGSVEWPLLHGWALIKLHQLDEAIEHLRRGVEEESDPNNQRQGRQLLARALHERSRQLALHADASADALAHAEAMAREALRITPADGGGALAALALVQYRATKISEARQSATQAVNRNPGLPLAWLVSAMLSAKQGDRQTAVRELERAKSALRGQGTLATELAGLIEEAEACITEPGIHPPDVGDRPISK